MSGDVLVPDWPAPPTVIAGTTTRNAGADALPAAPRFMQQVHGANVVSAAELRASGSVLRADAVTGSRPGDLCVVRTADCLPLLLCAKHGREVAAVHAGWRGLAAGVIEATLSAMATPPPDLIAWLGPAISQPAFEVGDDVYAAFVGQDANARDHFEPNSRGRWQADLYGLARMRLNDAGLEDVHGGDFCTYRDTARFYSYRRNPECGRMLSYVGIRATAPTASARPSRPS